MDIGSFESVYVTTQHCVVILSVAYVLMKVKSYKVHNPIKKSTFLNSEMLLQDLHDVS